MKLAPTLAHCVWLTVLRVWRAYEENHLHGVVDLLRAQAAWTFCSVSPGPGLKP